MTTKRDWREEGKKDGRDGVRNPPHDGTLDYLFDSDKNKRDREDYYRGQEAGKAERERSGKK